MVRKIVVIDREKCNGCGACAEACHEHAIGMIDGKAQLLRDDYCDGLGDCLPACPVDAISFEMREAADYDEAAVKAHIAATTGKPHVGGCPGSAPKLNLVKPEVTDVGKIKSRLAQWPCQIKLAPINAAFFNGAKLLIAADCTGYAYGDFHRDFMDGRVTLIGCPKLDAVQYADKLTQIFAQNNIQDIVLTRMLVPCCGGLENAVKTAIAASGKVIPLKVVTISPDGEIVKVQ